MENVLYLVWNKDHESGMAIIDEQHRAMLGMINSLYYNLSKGRGLNTVHPTLRALEELAYIHLSTLLPLAEQEEYGKYREQAITQYELLQEAKRSARKAQCEADVMEIVQLLKDWWVGFHARQAA